MPQSNRINYIDLAKGICIILVMLYHSNIGTEIKPLLVMRMPFYFILSGLFYKGYDVKTFIIKKTNKLLLPFLFFCFVGYLISFIKSILINGEDFSNPIRILTERYYINGPIWFLIALFWSNILFYIIERSCKKQWQIAMSVVAFTALGIIWSRSAYFVILPLHIDVAPLVLPFFYIGYLLKRTEILYPNKYDKYDLLLIITSFSICFIFSSLFDLQSRLMSIKIAGNALLYYIAATSGSISLILLCKKIKTIPVVSYIGRYSIIPLCVHGLFGLFLGMFINNSWICFVCTLILSVMSIPICNKLIPYFCAQKDLIKLSNK